MCHVRSVVVQSARAHKTVHIRMHKKGCSNSSAYGHLSSTYGYFHHFRIISSIYFESTFGSSRAATSRSNVKKRRFEKKKILRRYHVPQPTRCSPECANHTSTATTEHFCVRLSISSVSEFLSLNFELLTVIVTLYV